MNFSGLKQESQSSEDDRPLSAVLFDRSVDSSATVYEVFAVHVSGLNLLHDAADADATRSIIPRRRVDAGVYERARRLRRQCAIPTRARVSGIAIDLIDATTDPVPVVAGCCIRRYNRRTQHHCAECNSNNALPDIHRDTFPLKNHSPNSRHFSMDRNMS